MPQHNRQPNPPTQPQAETETPVISTASTGGWWIPRPALSWTPISQVGSTAVVTLSPQLSHLQLAAVVVLAVTTQICETVKTVHHRKNPKTTTR